MFLRSLPVTQDLFDHQTFEAIASSKRCVKDMIVLKYLFSRLMLKTSLKM